jgi:hypothetical protein
MLGRLSRARPTISVICPTRHPGSLVARIMDTLRDHVHEIVIAADMRVGAEDLGWYASVADTLIRYEHIGANRHYSWLAAQARGDWLFLLDGDELPSAALIEALPMLSGDRRIAQYSLPIHWPWPDSRHRLTSEPWCSGTGLRLIRNDGRMSFHGRKHLVARDEFPQCHIDDLPVYHLDLLLTDVDQRRAKVQRYDVESFGLMTPEGRPFNEAFYLPETLPTAAVTAIPEVDQERIATVLTGRNGASKPVDPGTVPLHDASAVAWHWAGRVLPNDAYAGTVTLVEHPSSMAAGARGHVLWARVRNAGTARWPWGWERPPLIRLGVRWWTVAGDLFEVPDRSMLPRTIDPGEETLVPVSVTVPEVPGSYELVVDLVHENVRWFDVGTPVTVEVGPSAAQRLEGLRHRYGLIAPMHEVREVRASLGRRDALANDLVHHPLAADGGLEPEPAAIISDLPIGEWALDAATLAIVASFVRRERPTAVLELGSGTSTVLLAWLLRDLHGDSATRRVVSVDEDPHWAALTRQALHARGLDDVATVSQVPLGTQPGRPVPCYVPTESVQRALEAAPPTLVLVDGPTLDSGASRLGAVELVRPFLRGRATLLLDDAFRDAELLIGEAWAREPDVTVAGIAIVGKGLLVARLDSAQGIRRRLRRLLT